MTLPPALADHLGQAVTSVCHCWRLTRTDGQVSGYTDHDRTITLEGLAFLPETGLSASEARSSLGLAVDTVDVEGALSADSIRDVDIAEGLYDNATVETFLVNWRSPEQFVLLRTATIGKITRSDQRFVAELESPSHALDQPRGRYVVRACDAELGDQRCGVALDTPQLSGSGTVTAYLLPDMVKVTGLNAFAPAWFAHGTLTWTAGARAGRSERLVDHRREGSYAILALAARDGPAVAAGDTFVVRAGCDKAFATCKAKFGNALNFRGFPHLPGNDAGYSYVAEGGVFDGRPIVP
ncbi:DUF2163 domain-containing protein [Aminobacter sp. HY435]|uniref:DUF2163 domain-containing protein n=1 Tax=Aminobacter sp. HY435 TaxID=2970917 RepID=UPI0022B9746C|nr:DUF2163 domain-containing protein [Aminobacter sp. HY435]